MKYFELTKEEKRILEDYEQGKYLSVEDLAKQKKLYQKYAKNTLSKTRNINIRLSEKVLARLKAKAAEAGLPYQTLASSILHRFSTQ
jgi:predicted DNA binding CopG/RHH family protein